MNANSNMKFNNAANEFERLWTDAYDRDVTRKFRQTHCTIKESMLDLLSKEGEKPLVKMGDVVVTRAEADAAACRLGNALLSEGVEKGSRISIIVPNRPEIVETFMACYKTGFVAAAFNQRSTGEEIVRTVASVESSVIVIENATLPKIAESLEAGELPSVSVVVVMDADNALTALGPVRVLSWEAIQATADASEPAVEITNRDNALLLFTGGTTGVPKGCVQTHGRMVLELQSMHHWCQSALRSPDPLFLVCMPMTHIMGINYGVNWQVINGGAVAIGDGHSPERIIDAFNRFKPTVWAALPTLLHSVSKTDDLATCSYKDLDLVIFGGSFIARELLERLATMTHASFVESYGMSESFGFVTCNPVRSGGKVGSIGLPISNTDVLIVDSDEGTRPLNPGERGEIIFRGPQIIHDYWNNPEETAHALRGGWLYSGDIGYMDEDGFFYVVDRKKDTIVVSGFNVFPKEIDELLMSHPNIVDACTIGVPDEHSGERPKSFIVVDQAFHATEEELIAFCKQHLVAYKAPRYFEVLSEIPKTKNRKPDREKLKRIEREKGSKKA